MSSPLVFQKTISATTKLNRQQMWKALYNKIKHPEKYVGSRDVKITGETPTYVDREQTVGPPDHPMVIKERITWSESEGVVTFTEHNNEQKTGSVVNRIEQDDNSGIVTVVFVFDWHWTDKADRKAVEAQIKQFEQAGDKAVKDTVKAAEEENA